MNQDQQRAVVEALVAAGIAGSDGSIRDSQAHEVAAVVAPLLAEREEERDNAVTVGDRLGWRLVEAEEQLKVLKWLHAEASYWLALDRDEHESAEALDSFHRRAVYAEQRYEVGRREIARLRREVEFEANGADTFSGADALAEQGGPQCSVHPDGGGA